MTKEVGGGVYFLIIISNPGPHIEPKITLKSTQSGLNGSMETERCPHVNFKFSYFGKDIHN